MADSDIAIGDFNENVNIAFVPFIFLYAIINLALNGIIYHGITRLISYYLI